MKIPLTATLRFNCGQRISNSTKPTEEHDPAGREPDEKIQKDVLDFLESKRHYGAKYDGKAAVGGA